MPRYTGSFLLLFLVWMPRTTNAQGGYEPPSASPSLISMPHLNTFSYLVLIGVGGLIAFLITYRVMLPTALLYYPFPRIYAPDFDVVIAIGLLALAAPVFASWAIHDRKRT